jgi:hypothetical protein
MKSKDLYISLLAWLTGILVTFVTLLYPVGQVFTNPVQVNKAFDNINIEKSLITLYSDFLKSEINQVTALPPETKSTLYNQIDYNMITESSLKKQRQKAVNTFFEKIEENEIPYFTFNFANPFYTIYEKANETSKNLISQLLDQEFCTEVDVPQFLNKFITNENDDVKCFSLKKIFGNNEDNTDLTTTPTYQISTSFGVTGKNLSKIHKTYIFLKYLPPNLLLFTALLYGIILIPLLMHSEKDEWYKTPFKILAQNILLNLILWILFPVILRIFEPFNPENLKKLDFLQLQSQTPPFLNTLSDILNKLLYQLGKQMQIYALITSIIFITIFVIYWIIWIGLKKIKQIDNEEAEKNKIEV